MLPHPNLYTRILGAPDASFPWDAPDLRDTEWWRAMAACPQDPVHHAEGDVATHTRMVVETLQGLGEWKSLPHNERGTLLVAALLHDVAKPETTREEEGRITARGHSGRGELTARRMLYEAGGVPFAARETVAALIRAHQRPFYLIEREDAVFQALRISHSGATCRHLTLLAEADALGRICTDQDAMLLNVALFREFAGEHGCLDAPYAFANDDSRYVYFRTEGVRDPAYSAYAQPGRPDLIVMAGLPGAGKDTFIRQNLPDVPVVSLDTIRARLGVAPDEPQERVAGAAREEAKTYLRRGESVVWNATNLSREIRAGRLRLADDYGARVRIIYVEVPAEIQRRQNRARLTEIAIVPDSAIQRMLRRWEVPDATEAHTLTLSVRE